jgi:hemolysin III
MTTRMDTEQRERLADLAVHALGLILGVAGAIVMLTVAARGAARDQLLASAVYLFGLIAMLACSALYNVCVWWSFRHRDWLRRLDHAAIFVMIAGTYTPLALRLPAAWASGLIAGVWTAAIVGVAAKLWQPHRVEALSVALYLALGWIGLIALEPLLASLDGTTLLLLLLGGVVYSAGVVFHLAGDGRYGKALWHGCVLIAAAIHYVAILSMLEA